MANESESVQVEEEELSWTEYLREQGQRRQSLLQLQLQQVKQYHERFQTILERLRMQHRNETSDLNRMLNADKDERQRRMQTRRHQRLESRQTPRTPPPQASQNDELVVNPRRSLSPSFTPIAKRMRTNERAEVELADSMLSSSSSLFRTPFTNRAESTSSSYSTPLAICTGPYFQMIPN